MTFSRAVFIFSGWVSVGLAVAGLFPWGTGRRLLLRTVVGRLVLWQAFASETGRCGAVCLRRRGGVIVLVLDKMSAKRINANVNVISLFVVPS